MCLAALLGVCMHAALLVLLKHYFCTSAPALLSEDTVLPLRH